MGSAPYTHNPGWPTVRLSDLTTKIGSGATPTGGESSYRPTRQTFALVRSQNVFDRRFSWEGLAFISDDQAERLAGVRLQRDDLLLNITGDGVTFARACRVDETVLPACVNQHVAIVRADATKASAGYLLAYLTHPAVKAYIESFNAGGSRRAITKGHIQSFRLPLPPLDVQERIARALGALDDKIDLNRRTSETLEAMARALFKSWFVDFDPVTAKAEGRAPAGMDSATAALFPDGFENSDLGDIPRGWKLTKLKELTSKIGSGATPTGGDRNYVEEGVAFIRSQNVYDSMFVWEGLARIDHSSAEQLRGVTVQKGDVLLNITGASILRTCLVVPSVLPARVNQHVAIVRAQEGVPPCFLHLHLLEPSTKAYLLGMDAGGSRQAVTKAHIESVPVLLPSAPVLARFEDMIGLLVSSKHNLLDESRTLGEVRDALLPKLLSGELRVRDAEKSVEHVA